MTDSITYRSQYCRTCNRVTKWAVAENACCTLCQSVRETKTKTVFDTLRSIRDDHQWQQICFSSGRRVDCDVQTASMLLAVYDALSEVNHEKYRTMLQTFGGFQRLVSFGWNHVK